MQGVSDTRKMPMGKYVGPFLQMSPFKTLPLGSTYRSNRSGYPPRDMVNINANAALKICIHI